LIIPEPESDQEGDACPIQAKLFEMASKFDVKKFRQNLKAGNFYDGKICNRLEMH
jgi:hypothetical protein